MGQRFRCRQCQRTFSVEHGFLLEGLAKFCSPRCRDNYRQTIQTKTQTRRTALRRISEKMQQQRQAERRVRTRVFQRDNNRCRLAVLDPTHRCMGGLTKHELVKRSHWRVGALDEDNCVTLCWYANAVWVETHPREARELGLVRSVSPAPDADSLNESS